MLTVKLEDLAERPFTPDMHRYCVIALSRSMIRAVGTKLRQLIIGEVGAREVEETSEVDRVGDVIARLMISGRSDDKVEAKYESGKA